MSPSDDWSCCSKKGPKPRADNSYKMTSSICAASGTRSRPRAHRSPAPAREQDSAVEGTRRGAQRRRRGCVLTQDPYGERRRSSNLRRNPRSRPHRQDSTAGRQTTTAAEDAARQRSRPPGARPHRHPDPRIGGRGGVPAVACPEQTVEIALGPTGAFENGNIRDLARRVPTCMEAAKRCRQFRTIET